MNNDRDPTRNTAMDDREMRDRNVTDTMKRSKTERGEIESDRDTDDKTQIRESMRSDIGAGE